MSHVQLSSCLADPMQRFIELRRLAGTDYDSQARLLSYFDRFLTAQGVTEPRVTREITDSYQGSLRHLGPRTQQNRRSVVRQFCEYLARTDPLGYVPESFQKRPSPEATPRHNYSPTEIRALLAAAGQLPRANSLRPQTYQTLLGLLYSTGIRIGEAFALNLEDFHRDGPSLYIAAGKFRKARWVPLSGSACDALARYVQTRSRLSPLAPDSPLFLNQRCSRLHHPSVYRTFQHLLRQCGLPQQAYTGPRIHDLRHTFAVHRLLAWYRDGQDVNARLPWLATYMGHVGIQSTQVYLQATAELLQQVDRRFYQHYLQHVKPQGGPP